MITFGLLECAWLFFSQGVRDLLVCALHRVGDTHGVLCRFVPPDMIGLSLCCPN